MAIPKVERATGSAAIATSLSAASTGPIELVCVKLNMSATGGAAENFTVTVNAAAGAAYDTIIFAQDMNAVQDLFWLPDQPIPITNADVLDFAYANSNSRTYGIEITYRRLVA